MSKSIVIYCPFTSKRLLYVLDWIFKSRLGVDYTLTNNTTDFSDLCISYGSVIENAISIPSCRLLDEQGIKQHEIKTGEWNNIPTLYAENNDTIPFDIFSAVFFLISRYEEYYSFTPDKHGRYPATDSILYKNGWLERPLVDEWIEALRLLLQQKGGFTIPTRSFSYLPTYDIDIAWSYKNKGLVRGMGGFVKDILSLRVAEVAKRISVLSGAQDPYFSFDSIALLHKKYNYTPVYFVLATLRTGEFDKNISPLHPDMQQLIQSFANEGTLGVHPSYNMNTNNAFLEEEKSSLEKISGMAISQSRQHYIRLWFPRTYRQLIAAGITDDYSMGYGTHLGFRAGTGLAFNWYDLETETATALQVHPFCFMDSTAHYELKLSAAEAFARLNSMSTILQKQNSQLITVFHNFSLGTDNEWKNWAASYASFLEKMSR